MKMGKEDELVAHATFAPGVKRVMAIGFGEDYNILELVGGLTLLKGCHPASDTAPLVKHG